MQWERKIEQAERGGRFDRDPQAPTAEPQRSKSEAADPRPVRFERSQESPVPSADRPAPRADRPLQRTERVVPSESAAPAAAIATATGPAAERRTITITGHPTPARRRSTLAERHLAAQPDRIALWAFLLGLLLIAVAAGTAHA